MYPNTDAADYAERAAFIMASTGETVTYAAFNARANRLAHLLRAEGLQHQDHYAIMMENNDRYMEACAAGERAGLYYTCVNSYLTADELAYILTNSESQILITSAAKLEVAQEAVAHCAAVKLVLVVGAAELELAEGLKTTHLPAAVFQKHRLPTTVGNIHALFIRYHRRPKGIRPLPPAPGSSCNIRLSGAVALPRRHGLSVCGTAVSLSTANRSESNHSPWRDGDYHGAFRSAGISGAD